MKRRSLIAPGLMSGASLDGIDALLTRISPAGFGGKAVVRGAGLRTC
jgi:hypothetical protein